MTEPSQSEKNNQSSFPHNSSYEKYESALALKFYEGQISWQMNVLFVGLNIGIGTIIQNKLEKFAPGDSLTIVMAIVGLIINVFWLGTFRRNNRYYNFRMAQAREAEPEAWELLTKRGYKFSKGKRIVIDTPGIKKKDKLHKLSWFEKKATNKNAILVSILLFIGCFALLLLLSIWPWCQTIA